MNVRFLKFFLIGLGLFMMEGSRSLSHGQERATGDVRNPILAGTWYPGTQEALSKAIKGYLLNAERVPVDGEVKALIVPHAGYKYSGQVAAHAYRLLQDKDFERVIMIGPSHRVGFRGVSVNLQSGYRTPLGLVPVDRDFAKRMLNKERNIQWVAHAHAMEHSLEIQIPFLQSVLKEFRIIPILMGDQDFGTCNDLAQQIIDTLGRAEKTLLLASTDLSHFHNYDGAKELDSEFVRQVSGFDPKGLSGSLSSGRCEACGGGAAVTVMLAAKAFGANQSVILHYANSGDVTGDRRGVVGYLSSALVKTK
ncbi:MAG: AmmeMemoRadiSam system protein B [Pseudomonadota bacterium]